MALFIDRKQVRANMLGQYDSPDGYLAAAGVARLVGVCLANVLVLQVCLNKDNIIYGDGGGVTIGRQCGCGVTGLDRGNTVLTGCVRLC